MANYLTSGQVARRLHVSVSTLKRWLGQPDVKIAERRNGNGWRLFTEHELGVLKSHKRKLKRDGKRFNDTTLIPVSISSSAENVSQKN